MEMCGLAQELEWLGARRECAVRQSRRWAVRAQHDGCAVRREIPVNVPNHSAPSRSRNAVITSLPGQTVGDRKVLELAALGFEPIDTARRARVDVAGPVVGQAPDSPAAQPVGNRVGGEAGTFGRRIV